MFLYFFKSIKYYAIPFRLSHPPEIKKEKKKKKAVNYSVEAISISLVQLVLLPEFPRLEDIHAEYHVHYWWK